MRINDITIDGPRTDFKQPVSVLADSCLKPFQAARFGPTRAQFCPRNKTGCLIWSYSWIKENKNISVAYKKSDTVSLHSYEVRKPFMTGVTFNHILYISV